MQRDMTWDVIAKDVEGLSRRFEAVSQNMANGNTPRYARREVSFEDQLKELIDGPTKLPLAVTDTKHIPRRPLSVNDVVPEEVRIYDEWYRLDGNNVDPERENALLNQTRMGYTAMNRMLGRKFGLYKAVIGGR